MSYIDPGSGSMAVQLFLATLVGLMLTLRKRIVGLFGKFFH